MVGFELSFFGVVGPYRDCGSLLLVPESYLGRFLGSTSYSFAFLFFCFFCSQKVSSRRRRAAFSSLFSSGLDELDPVLDLGRRLEIELGLESLLAVDCDASENKISDVLSIEERGERLGIS